MADEITNDDIIDTVAEAYWSVHNAMPDLLSKAKDQQEQMQLIHLRDALRDSFWAIHARKLEDFNKQVEQFFSDLKNAVKEFKAELESLQTAVQVIGVITEMAKLAAALATLAAVA